jgi:CRISPR-associated protein Csx10
MRYRAYAVTETPAAISVRRATGNDLDTQRFLPGTVVRGALAAAYLEESGTPDDGFDALFLKRQVRFGDLRIGDARPWPHSTRQCSFHPDDHDKVDHLLREGAQGAARVECAKCEAKLEVPKGYYRFKKPDDSHPFQYSIEKVHSHRLAHSEVDPAFLTAKPGQFHSSQLLDRGQTFEGFFHARKAGEESLLKLIGAGRTLYLGRGRSRGQGRVRLSIFPEPGRGVERMREKIRRLNEVAARFRAMKNSTVFSCTLDSAALVYDRWLCSRSFLEATDFSVDLRDYTEAACFRRLTDVAGWHAKGGLPKAEVTAIAAGSCFLFRNDAVIDREAEYGRLAKILMELEERGIGERLDEGFGEATFCRTCTAN